MDVGFTISDEDYAVLQQGVELENQRRRVRQQPDWTVDEFLADMIARYIDGVSVGLQSLAEMHAQRQVMSLDAPSASRVGITKKVP